MKKLMIGMLAAGAAIASAWAENDAVQFSTEAFENAAPDFTVAPWSYTGDADAELTIKTGGGSTTDGKYLELNTASKKLSLAPTAIGKYAVTNEVYFDSWVKFDAASDTIPDVGTGDKLALFVLDDTDYIPETDTPSKALYVIGGYMNGETLEKRLYKLSTTVNDKFLADFNHISIKMYENVMASGTSVPGFLIKVGDTVAQVDAAYTTDAKGAWVLGETAKLTVKKGEYLGAAIDPAVAASRYNSDKGELILGLDKGDSELNAVDFMGKGGIDALAFTNVKNSYGFKADAQLFIIDAVTGVQSVKDSEGNVVTQFTADGTTTNLTVVLAPGYYYGGATGEVTIPVTLVAGGSLSGVLNSTNLFEPVAIVGTTQYEDNITFAAAVASGVAGNIVLLADVNIGEQAYFVVNGEGNSTLDLNGWTLTAGAVSASTALAIIDSKATGVINGFVGGAVTINAGTFNGTVTGATIPVTSTAKFLATANTAATLEDMLTGQEEGFTYSFDGDTYLTIVATAASNNKVVVDGEISTDNQATADANVAKIEEELVANGATENAKAWVTKIYGDKGVPADALVRAKNIDISVKFDLPLMQNDPVITVEASTVEAPAEGQPENVAAFEFTIKDGETEVVPATLAKVIKMVQYVESLTGTWAEATSDDVATKINGTKIKVQLKKKNDKNCGFMKLKLK